MRGRRGKIVAIVAGAGVLVLAVFVGVYWKELSAWYRFVRTFETIGQNEQGLMEYRHRQTGIVFVRLPGGAFDMGLSKEDGERAVEETVRARIERSRRNGTWRGKGSKEERERFVEETLRHRGEMTRKSATRLFAAAQPRHNVVVSPFLIAKFEVTQAEWERTMGSLPARFKGGNSPVENISWDDCQEFCRKTGLSLPTEAQWEYASRAGTTGPFAGTGRLDEMGWYVENSGPSSTQHPVGQKKPNDFGLYDMHGNILEWCVDVFDEKFYNRPEARQKDPVCTSGSAHRVVRSGSWISSAAGCRSDSRAGFLPSERNFTLGLRPVWPNAR